MLVYPSLASATVLSGLYVAGVYIYRFFAPQSSQGARWAPAKRVYNAAQIALSGAMAVNLFPSVRALVAGDTRTPVDASLELWSTVFLLSKYVDWVDTVFILADRSWRRLSFLHVFHHASMPVACTLVAELISKRPGLFFPAFGVYTAWVNSVVHTLMYTHYMVASLGFKNPLKRHLTLVQLTQFVTIGLQAVYSLLVYEWRDPAVVQYKRLMVFQGAYQLVMLALFSRYYAREWRPADTQGLSPK